MKLISKKQSDRIFNFYSEYRFNMKKNDVEPTLNADQFNTALNAVLMDNKIIKSALRKLERNRENEQRQPDR